MARALPLQDFYAAAEHRLLVVLYIVGQNQAQLLIGIGIAGTHPGLPGHQYPRRGGHPGQARQLGHRLHALAHNGRIHGAVGAQDEFGEEAVLLVVQQIGPLGL